MKTLMPVEVIERKILLVRGEKVLLDADLAELYGVTTKRLTEQVKRNNDRFPADFAFQLTEKEWADLKSQFATSSLRNRVMPGDEPDRSPSAVSSSGHGGRRKLPWVLTEHGAIMAATVLNSKQASVA